MKKLIVITLLLAVGVIAGISFERYQTMSAVDRVNTQETALMHAKKHLDPDYVCPMHSQIVSDEPGSCPICGMDLVEIKADTITDDNDDAYPTVRIPSTMINNMGVRVAQVERKTLVRQIETPGFITKVQKLNFTRYKAPAKGRVVEFHFKYGEWHEPGDPLVDLELDDLVLVQEKHLELLAKKNAEQKNQHDDNNDISTINDTALNDPGSEETTAEEIEPSDTEPEAVTDSAKPVEPSIEKTRLLMRAAGMTDVQIETLEKTKVTSPVVTLYAKHAGEVERLSVDVGDDVKSNELLFTFGGMMRVTVIANAFQRDASWVRPGQDVDVILPHSSSKPFKGKVNSGAVSININSQNIGVEFTFDAPNGVVKTGMYVVGNIYGQIQQDTLTLPRESIIYSRGEKRVIVALGEGRFKPVVVETGISNDNEVEILSGIEEGDTVVVSAQFLIDSESSLQSSYRRMTGVEH